MQDRTATGSRPARWLLLAISMLPLAGLAATQDLKIGGTGNALGTMRMLGDAFTKLNPDVRVVILPSLGSSGAVKAVPRGAIDIGLTSRPLTPQEEKLGASALEYARAPLVFAVSAASPVRALTLGQVADIYSGKTLNWPDGGQIRPVLRQVGDDNTRQLRRMSPAMDQALAIAEKRLGLPFAVTDQENADKTERIPGAISVMTLNLILSEKRALRALALDGVEPTAANAASGSYPHAKAYFLITRTDHPAAVARFIAFVRSPAGREVLAATGHWIP